MSQVERQSAEELLAKMRLTNSSLVLLELGLGLFTNTPNWEEELSLAANTAELTELLKVLHPPKMSWEPPKASGRSRVRTLYDMAEYLELLRNFFPEKFREREGAANSTGVVEGDGWMEKDCLPIEDMMFFDGAIEQGLVCQEVGHPLSPLVFRGVQESLRYTLAFVKMENTLEKYCSDNSFEERSALLLLRTTIDWHRKVMSLSGAYGRHCEKCKLSVSCRGGIFAPDEWRLSDLIEQNWTSFVSSGLSSPPFLEDIGLSFNQLARLGRALQEYELMVGGEPIALMGAVDQVRREAGTLSEILKSKSKAEVWNWWRQSMIVGLRDLVSFFERLSWILDETEKRLAAGTSESLKKLGEDVLKSLTLEEIYDYPSDSGPTIPWYAASPETWKEIYDHPSDAGHSPGRDVGVESSAASQENEQRREASFRFLKVLYSDETPPLLPRLSEMRKSMRGKSEAAAGDSHDIDEDAKQSMLKKLYEDLYEEPDKYMDLPRLLKERFFCQTVHAFQSRLAMSAAADLLHAYYGRCRSGFINFLEPLALPFLRDFSYRAISWIWFYVLAGFVLAAWLNQWEWYAGILLVWAVSFVIRLWWEHQKETMQAKETPPKRLPKDILGQLLPGFLVPMFVLVSPLGMSDEISRYVYQDLLGMERLLTNILMLILFSLFAILKLQGPQEPVKGMFVVFAVLWPQAFVISFFSSLPYLISLKGSGSCKLLDVPPSVAMLEFPGHSFCIYPMSSLALSVLCLFAAIFLEGLYRKK